MPKNKKLVILLGPSAIGKSTLEKTAVEKHGFNPVTIYGARDKRVGECNYELIDGFKKHKDLFTYYDKDGYKYTLCYDDLLEGTSIISIISNSSTKRVIEGCLINKIDYVVVHINNSIDYIRKSLKARGDIDIDKRIEFITDDESIVGIPIKISFSSYRWTTDFELVSEQIARLK